MASAIVQNREGKARLNAVLHIKCSASFAEIIRELTINDAATPRRGVNMYDKKKVFWNLMSVTTV